MINSKLKIGISLRIINAENYDEKRDAISHDWPLFLEKIKSNIVLIPNTLTNVEDFLNDIGVNGLILSGGDNIGDDKERDDTENKILNFAIKHEIPLLGICRGMQVINKFFNGSIEKNNDSSHVGNSHNITLVNNNIVSLMKKNSLKVNSFHNNIITNPNLGKNIEPFAIVDKDKTIEGFFHKTLPIVGIMWHPERDSNNDDQLILEYIFSKKLFWNE
jgi:N5-(cytidine 5'-diphosphoramidyl)-L-glutamine hydrolase